MKKLLQVFSLGIFLSLLSTMGYSQLKTITGTVTDQTGQIWKNASIRVDFLPTPGRNPPFIWSGGSYGSTINTITDTNGYFSIQLAPNDQIVPALSNWGFTICPNASTQCSTFSISITSAGPGDVSTIIQNNIIKIGVAAIAIPRAYNDNEITPVPLPGGQYYNTTVKTPRFWDGTQFQSFLGTGVFNIFNTTTLNSDLYPGADVCARILSADAALGTNNGTITVNISGTCTTSVNVSIGHNLLFTAPVIMGNYITLKGSNIVSCSGDSSTLTSSWTPTTPTGSVGPGAPFFLAADDSDDITIQGCKFYSYGAKMLIVSGEMTNARVINNIGIGTTLFRQSFQTGGLSLTVANHNLFQGNTVDMTTTGSYGQYGVEISGRWEDVRILGNGFYGANGGADIFGADASTYPTYAQLLASYTGRLLFEGNTCNNLGQSCFFGSGNYDSTVVGNVSTNTGDYGFGCEGCADSTISYNNIKNAGITAGSGCLTIAYFSSYNNSAIGNDCTQPGDAPLLFVKNNGGNAGVSLNSSYIGNHLKCGGVACAFIHQESTAFQSVIGNDILNGGIDRVGKAEASVMKGNNFTWTVAARNGAGVLIEDLYQSYNSFTENTITTSIAQAGIPCLSASSSDGTGTNTYEIAGNKCFGWDTGLAIGGYSNGIFNVHFNLLPMLPTTTIGTLYHFSNYTLAGAHD